VIAIRREIMEKIVKKYGKEIEKCKTLKDLVKLFKKISKKEGLKILDLSAHQTPSSSPAPTSSPLPRLPANEPGSDAGRPAKGERLREVKEEWL